MSQFNSLGPNRRSQPRSEPVAQIATSGVQFSNQLWTGLETSTWVDVDLANDIVATQDTNSIGVSWTQSSNTHSVTINEPSVSNRSGTYNGFSKFFEPRDINGNIIDLADPSIRGIEFRLDVTTQPANGTNIWICAGLNLGSTIANSVGGSPTRTCGVRYGATGVLTIIYGGTTAYHSGTASTVTLGSNNWCWSYHVLGENTSNQLTSRARTVVVVADSSRDRAHGNLVGEHSNAATYGDDSGGANNNTIVISVGGPATLSTNYTVGFRVRYRVIRVPA